MQQWGVNYWETYAPVVNWIGVRFLAILSEIAGLESQGIDFALAFPQAELDVTVLMELRMGMAVAGSSDPSKTHVIRLRKSLYGLQLRGFTESGADPCIFIKASMSNDAAQSAGESQLPRTTDPSQRPRHTDSISKFKHTSADNLVLVYVDDCIILSCDKASIQLFIESLKHGPENFVFIDKGSMDKYLGVEIEWLSDGTRFKMTHPFENILLHFWLMNL